MSKKALLTGITGQDASCLAEILVAKGYEVHGIVRRSSLEPKNLENLAAVLGEIRLHEGDLTDQSSLSRVVALVQPDELYCLGAQSHVGVSFGQPELTANVTGLGFLRLLEAVRACGRKTKIYQASSSEMFGDVAEEPQNEDTQLRARSPYGAAKIFAHHMAKVYRESYGMFISCGILFNHEEPGKRGLNFVTRKITNHVAKQVLGLTKEPLELGNLDARRDWGRAMDYCEAMWLMLQQDKPDDFVIATGETHTVREFVEAAYKTVGVVPLWNGQNEKAEMYSGGYGNTLLDGYPDQLMFGSNSRKPLVRVNPAFYRPADVHTLTGDASKARKILGWQPKTTFKELVRLMVEADLKLLGGK